MHIMTVGAAAAENHCLSALRKGYAKVVSMEGKESGRCLALAANGRLGFPPTLAACSANDPRGKIARVAAKALGSEIAACRSESLPAFAVPDLDGEPWSPGSGASFSGAMSAAAGALDTQLFSVLLGADFDSAVVLRRSINFQTPGARINPLAAKCQGKVVTT
ncbi:MAG: hypothetical protein P8R45_03905, partial [Candidatus Binatia bacterium]|nr:hypothetical protein [Candidatus Binatia bacterium]